MAGSHDLLAAETAILLATKEFPRRGPATTPDSAYGEHPYLRNRSSY